MTGVMLVGSKRGIVNARKIITGEYMFKKISIAVAMLAMAGVTGASALTPEQQKQLQQQKFQQHKVQQQKVTPQVQQQKKFVNPQGGNQNNQKKWSNQNQGGNKWQKNVGPKNFGPAVQSGGGGAFKGLKQGGVGKAYWKGQNYSIWRGPHRVRYGNRWRTFVGLGALSALAIGGATYYPYAYLDAPQDYCDGLNDEGCQLRWQGVQTEEGDIVPQCVAYCPWQ